MNIEYQNFKSELYQLGKDDMYGYYFRSEQPISSITDKTISLYSHNDEHIISERVYIELANIDSVDKALDFCTKYGALVQSNVVMNEIFKYIETNSYFSECQSSTYDYILFDHLRYYQITINCLIQIRRIISHNSLKTSDLVSLFFYCVVLLANPHFYDLYSIEYQEAITNDYRLQLFAKYPVFKFMHTLDLHSPDYDLDSTLNILSISDKIYYNPHTISTLSKCIEQFPKESLRDFFKTMLSDYALNLQSATCKSFLLRNQKKLIELAKYLFCEVLSFEIRETKPVVTLETFNNFNSWEFCSLANAIFYFFYIDCSNGSLYRQCQNEKCKKLFTCPTSRTNKIYCSASCAHKVANRKYKSNSKEK